MLTSKFLCFYDMQPNLMLMSGDIKKCVKQEKFLLMMMMFENVYLLQIR